MASFFRSAIASGSRSLASRSRSLLTAHKPTLCPNSMPSPLSSPPSTRAIPIASRVVSALGIVDTLLPLHTATANARLRSSIGLDSSCWSILSQGLATPL